MGGQIMPPVMGAVAFIMAETINVPYIEICKAAIIPAVLYFVTAFWMVHLEAGRKGLLGLPKEECPDPWAAIKRQWLVSAAAAGGLVALLFSGYTPLFSGTVGLGLTVVLIFGAAVLTGVQRAGRCAPCSGCCWAGLCGLLAVWRGHLLCRGGRAGGAHLCAPHGR
jgi:TRAP-type uncharacterized transport system fused permease subunit